MAKKTLLTDGAIFHKVKSGFITDGGVYRKIKKAFVTDGGVYCPCWGGGVADMEIVLPAGSTDNGVVTMGGTQYRLLTITQSGTVKFAEPVTGEVWMCGGGTSGRSSNAGLAVRAGGGGAGAFTASGQVALSGSMVAVVGSGGATMSTDVGGYNFGGASSFGGIATSVGFSANSKIYYGVRGGTGGGSSGNTAAGTGDGVTKYPFGDSTYFAHPHCGGGGAGGSYANSSSARYSGGAGGTNGGSGAKGADSVGNAMYCTGGAGGEYGGGRGGNHNESGTPAAYYGSGGGGGGYYYSGSKFGNGGAGYQGVIYIRIPVNQ